MILNHNLFFPLWHRAREYMNYKEFTIFLDGHYGKHWHYSYDPGVGLQEDNLLWSRLENYFKFLNKFSIEVVEK